MPPDGLPTRLADPIPKRGSELDGLRGLIAAHPACLSLRANLAQALLDAGAFDPAIAEATICLDQDPVCLQALLVRAEAHKAQWRHGDAVDDYTKASAVAPDRPLILVCLATCLVELDQMDQAERVLRRSVARAPYCKEALANLGSLMARRGALAEAEAPCRAALLLDDTLVCAHQNLSVILAEADPAAARRHRDAAYQRQQLFISQPPAPRRSVLVLAAADAANIPLRHLFDRAHTTLITWCAEYATADQDRSLPPFDLVFNGIGEPDFAPVLPPAVVRLLAAQGCRVLNHPDRVACTTRAQLPALLDGVPGIVTPAARGCEGGPMERDAAANALGFPLLIRPRGSHGGEGLVKLENPAALALMPNDPCTLTQFVDFMSPDGFYRKYRVIFIDRVPYPYHLAIGPHWLVHHCTTGMEHDPIRREEERRYLTAPERVIGPAAMAALCTIGTRLDLDYAGIDFSLRADGTVLVFEANATMLVHPEPADGPFAYRNHAFGAIHAAFERMLVRRAATGPMQPSDESGLVEASVITR